MVKRRTWWTREFKLAAIGRMETAPSVEGLAAELGIRRELLLRWRRAYEAGGAEALRFPGQRAGIAAPLRPPVAPAGEEPLAEVAGSARRVAELERKVGEQQLDLDFFRAALRHVRGQRRGNGGSGGKASTR